MNVVEIVLNAINNTGSVLGEVSQDLDDVGNSAEQAGKKLQNIGASTAKVGAGLTAGVTLPLAAVGMAAVNSASDLQETIGKVDVVFGEQSDAIQAWADNAATALGSSKQEALDMASSMAILGNALELSGDDAAAWAADMTQRAADMGSFFNTSTQEAADAMTAALKGNFEQMEKYGVVMSAASVSQRALEMGLAETVTELTAQDKALASQAIIMEQTALAAGNFADTSTGLANSQKIVQAQIATLGSELGTVLLPIVEQAVGWISQLVERFSNLSPGMQQTIVIVAGLAAALGPVLVAFGAITSAIGTLMPVLAGLGGALGVILSPIGLITGAVVGLLAVLFNWGGANEKLAAQLEAWGLSGAAEFVTGLHEGMMGLVDTIGQLFTGNMTFSEFFEAGMPEWIGTLLSWTWPIIAPITWITKLTGWEWPGLSQPDWIKNLLDFRWPSFPTRPAWLGGGGNGNATGTSFFRGGVTMVGETGPELVSLPRGSRIFPAGQTEQMMAAGVGGMNITINANVSNEADITTLARRVAAEIQRRNR